MSFDFAASTRRLQERGRAYTDQLRRKAEKERIQQQRAAAAIAEAQKARRPVQKVDEEAVSAGMTHVVRAGQSLGAL